MRKKSTYKKKVEDIEVAHGPRVQPLLPMNAAQRNYIECIKRYTQVFVTGPAGTGKNPAFCRTCGCGITVATVASGHRWASGCL